MKQDTIIKIGLVIIAIAALAVVYFQRTSPNSFGAPATLTFDTATNTLASVSSTIVKVLDVNPQRVYASLTNDGAVVTYCGLNSTSTGITAGKGLRLSATGGNVTFHDGEYVGAIWCITSSGTSSLAIVEK